MNRAPKTVIALVVLVIVVTIGGALWLTPTRSSLYKRAVEQALSDPAVTQALGEPIETEVLSWKFA